MVGRLPVAVLRGSLVPEELPMYSRNQLLREQRIWWGL